MDNKEAVSTVIALMLILGIISTAIAIYSAVYLPGLKQQSEIEQSRQVADAFARIGSSIDYSLSQKKDVRFRETLPLGGGAVLLSPVRSSGMISIQKEDLFSMTVTNDSETKRLGISTVNISYVPSFTTWEPQGYRWESGFIAVTKDGIAVPQSSQYGTMYDALADSGGFFSSFIEFETNQQDLLITLINLTQKSDESCITGNSMATVGVNTTLSKDMNIIGVTELVYHDNSRAETDMEPYLKVIYNQMILMASDSSFNDRTYRLAFNPSVNVTVREVRIEVSVW